jgi:predicted RNA-binding Zn ribbon-like protein
MASNPAPGALELVRGFVNTLDVDEGIEELDSPAALRDWLAEHGLLRESGARVDEPALRRVVELREALRALLMHNGGLELDPEAPQVLDTAARRAGLAVRFGEHAEPRLEPSDAGVDGALGRVLAIVADAMEEGTWPRLKVCLADTCQWAFYDTSRNRSAVWCDMRVCGNRQKVRSFRERQRVGAKPD